MDACTRPRRSGGGSRPRGRRLHRARRRRPSHECSGRSASRPVRARGHARSPRAGHGAGTESGSESQDKDLTSRNTSRTVRGEAAAKDAPRNKTRRSTAPRNKTRRSTAPRQKSSTLSRSSLRRISARLFLHRLALATKRVEEKDDVSAMTLLGELYATGSACRRTRPSGRMVQVRRPARRPQRDVRAGDIQPAGPRRPARPAASASGLRRASSVIRWQPTIWRCSTWRANCSARLRPRRRAPARRRQGW